MVLHPFIRACVPGARARTIETMHGKSASLIAWLDPTQGEFLRAIAAAADLAIVGAGSQIRGQSSLVASMLKCDEVDDLRQALVEPRADILLILSKPELDFSQLAPTSMKIATLEPIPDSALAPVAGDWSPASTGPKATPVHFMPLVRFSQPVRAATELLTSFGEVTAMSHESLSLPSEGSLGARLFAAMDLVHLFVGEPDTIDAAYVPPTAPGAGGPGETLSGLHGSITCNLRFAGQRSVSLMLSNQAARWNNTTTLLGRGGRLRLFDDGFEWLDPTGRKLDEMRPKRSRAKAQPAAGAPNGPGAARRPSRARNASLAALAPAAESPAEAPAFSPLCIAAIADSLRRLLDNTLFPEPPADVTAALAMGQAALLSCRTGQPESPATIRRMLNAV